MNQINPPWTGEQVANLNSWQRSPYVHPFTCANRGDGHHRERWGDTGTLIATENGWVCGDCDYRQNWAHDYMAEEETIQSSNGSFGGVIRLRRGRMIVDSYAKWNGDPRPDWLGDDWVQAATARTIADEPW